MSDEELRAATELATAFHESYERLAPSFGYETRVDTRAFDPQSKNGRLMVAVCGEMLSRHYLSQPAPATDEQVAELNRLLSLKYLGDSVWGDGMLSTSWIDDGDYIERLREHSTAIIARMERAEANLLQIVTDHCEEDAVAVAAAKRVLPAFDLEGRNAGSLCVALANEAERLRKDIVHAMRLLNTTGRYSEGMDCLKSVVGEITYESVASGPAVAAIDAAARTSPRP